MTVEGIIRLLDLKPLPGEGGFYARSWTSDHLLPRKDNDKEAPPPFGTAIYYLLKADTQSAIHRVNRDELFHFYDGDPVELFHFNNNGSIKRHILGPRLESGERPQHAVPAGTWQGSRIIKSSMKKGYALMGTTVCPGFTWDSFELAQRDAMLTAYPNHQDLIKALTSTEPHA